MNFFLLLLENIQIMKFHSTRTHTRTIDINILLTSQATFWTWFIWTHSLHFSTPRHILNVPHPFCMTRAEHTFFSANQNIIF